MPRKPLDRDGTSRDDPGIGGRGTRTRRWTQVPAAWDALEDAAAEHLGSVGLGAVARARRENLSSVDVVHVSRANGAAGGNSRGATLISISNSMGGVIAGVGLGLLIALFNRPASATPPSMLEILFALIPSLVGGLMPAVAVTLQVASARRR